MSNERVEFFIRVNSAQSASDACIIIAEYARKLEAGEELVFKQIVDGAHGQKFHVAQTKEFLIVRELS